MKLLCRLGIHAWGRWLEANWTQKYIGEMEPRTGYGQVRYCSICNKRQQRKV